MPVAALKSLAAKTGLSPARAEYFWDGAKRIAARKGLTAKDPDYWRFVMGMTKKLAMSTKRKTMRGSKHTLATEARDLIERLDRVIGEVEGMLEARGGKLPVGTHRKWKKGEVVKTTKGWELKKDKQGRTIVPDDVAAKGRELKKDKQGRTIVPDDVAAKGAEMASRHIRNDNEYSYAVGRRIELENSRLKRDQKQAPEWKKKEEVARKQIHADHEEAAAFEKRHGVHPVGAWEAHHGRRWSNYRVDSGAGGGPDHVRQSDVKD